MLAFRLKMGINPFPDKPWFLSVCRTIFPENFVGKGEIPRNCVAKEKLLIMSNLSFSISVFKRLVQQTHKNQGMFGKGLTSHLPMMSI